MSTAKLIIVFCCFISCLCFAENKKKCRPSKTNTFEDIKNITYSLTPPAKSTDATDTVDPNAQYEVTPLQAPPEEDYDSPNTVYHRNGTTIKVDKRVRVKSSF